MANYAVLKAAINAVIKTNGNKEITGQVLNQTLMAIVDSLGENYQFAGVAVPSTNPGTPDQNIFYLATQAGTYTNFGATVLPAGISMLEWKNNTWSSETFFTIDDAPTAGSDHLVKSGGVKTAIDNVAFSTNEKVKDVGIDSTPTSGSDNLIKSGAVFDVFKNDGGAYDVSVHFPTGGVEGGNTYTLDGAIAMVPQNMKKGGMSIKFVSSSDNKYVQARCMAQNFTTDVTQWQGVDDKPTAGSDNLVKSGGVFNELGQVETQHTQDTSIFNISNALITLSDGSEGPYNGWIATPYIRFDINKSIKYKAGVNNNQVGLAFYDENKEFISESGVNALTTEQTITPPEGAVYFRACGFSGAYVTYTAPNTGIKGDIKILEDDIESINNEIGEYEESHSQDTSIFTLQNTLIDLDGTVESYNGWIATDFIKFDPTKNIYYEAGVNNNYVGLVFFDENKNAIDGSSVNAQIYERIITPPLNAVYFRACGFNGAYVTYNTNGSGMKGNISDLQEVISFQHESVTEDISTLCNSIIPTKDNLTTTHSKDYIEIGTKYTHHSYFKAPAGNNKCKLVISFPGGAAKAQPWYGYMHHGEILNSLGYAVLCITGYSVDWCHDKISPTTDAVYPVGNWMALEEATKAYQYIINKYNWIDRDGVYIYAESMGGYMAENFAELSGVPVLCTVLDSPCVSIKYNSFNPQGIVTALNAFYGIGTTWEPDKVIGCDPYTRNMSEEIQGTGYQAGSIVDFANVTAKKYRSCNSPMMVLLSDNDTTLAPSVTKGYVKALRNAGNMCDLKLYDLSEASGNHGVVQYTDVVGTINTVNATAGLVQMLEFFKRCGGYNYTLIE